MRSCDDGYPGCRNAESTGKWCIGPCPHNSSNFMVIELLRPVKGLRYSSQAGDRRVIRWSKETPKIVEQCREGVAIDWGGAMVQPGDYSVAYDGTNIPGG